MDTAQNNSASGAKFKGEILSKIYRIWLFRKFLPVFFAEILIFAVILYQFGRVVFVQKVLDNIVRISLQNPSGIFYFLWNAFEQAHTAAKILSVALVIFLALILRLATQGMLRWLLVRKNYFGKARPNES